MIHTIPHIGDLKRHHRFSISNPGINSAPRGYFTSTLVCEISSSIAGVMLLANSAYLPSYHIHTTKAQNFSFYN